MKEIPATLPLPDALPVHGFMLGLANQVVPHYGSWHPWTTAVNYLIRIAPIVYMAFQARSASPVGVQLDTSMGCDTLGQFSSGNQLNFGGIVLSITKTIANELIEQLCNCNFVSLQTDIC
ncbi:hypothetical protein DSO57_1033441 [Entomophthora muscae]|uniref:Uncharacterized protein n=1 Tax=Entomophthora muscae TaxID=34485 RepID=A0ACC2REX8_9FUNG|nr:hypothetical protein DSO57_1033441 [Entomophthora muscae]